MKCDSSARKLFSSKVLNLVYRIDRVLRVTDIDKDGDLSTRLGRRDHRPGATVQDDRKQSTTDALIQELMKRLYEAIQLGIASNSQEEIRASVTIYGGAVSRVIVGTDKIIKAD